MLSDVDQKVGVDLSSRALSFARAFIPDAKWFCCPIEKAPGTYDLVTCIETLEHIPDEEIEDFVASLHAKVSEKGVLVVSVPTVNRPLISKHYRHYTEEVLRQQLKPYFKIKQITWVYRICLLTKILNLLLENKVFMLRYAPALRLIFKIHKRLGFFGIRSNGAHLVAVASAN